LKRRADPNLSIVKLSLGLNLTVLDLATQGVRYNVLSC
jgi:hypothetical protein